MCPWVAKSAQQQGKASADAFLSLVLCLLIMPCSHPQLPTSVVMVSRMLQLEFDQGRKRQIGSCVRVGHPSSCDLYTQLVSDWHALSTNLTLAQTRILQLPINIPTLHNESTAALLFPIKRCCCPTRAHVLGTDYVRLFQEACLSAIAP